MFDSFTCKVSVIVAIYNAENTLPRLVQSLKNQTLTDFEVLLIDDGSTDSSGAICDRFALQDSRFKVFHKQNEGIGATRQFGIDHAAGKYTIHADADDWVEPVWLEQLYSNAVSTGADMVICDIIENRGEAYSKVLKQKPTNCDSKTVLFDLLLSKIHGGPWNKLVRLSCFSEYGIKYMAEQNYGEDFIVNALLLNNGIEVSYIPSALYHYETYINLESASQVRNRKSLEQREKMAEFLRMTFNGTEFNSIHNCRMTSLAYLSIQFNFYSESEYYSHYSTLASLKWKDYSKLCPLPYRIIVWSSFHLSFKTARFLLKIKQLYRKIDEIMGI